MQTIYLDNAASTMVDPKVVKAMEPYFTEKYGNASSLHHKGREAKEGLDRARRIISKSINAKADEIIFTGSGTEANNFCIKGVAFANRSKGNHIITTKIEHECVLASCKFLEKHDFKISYLNVDKEGFIDLDELEKAITPETILISVIHGNNEIGTIQDIEAIGKICRKHNILFHTDACQSFTKTDIDVKKHNIDLITINAHKIHGPKGVGALFIKKGTNIIPLMHGGGHEFGLRSGTENVAGIVGFAKAVQLADKSHIIYMAELRDRLIDGILKIPDTILNGSRDKRLCNNINVSFKHVEGESISALLETKGICSSTGSACSAKSLEPSHVLTGIGLKPEEAHGSLRLSISRFTTQEEIDKVLAALPGIITKLRRISPFAKMISRL